ncbi:hypothetical protein BB561_002915 [Smittium simulii]|uniref:Uncharacterized protein n=1 Tax=Smittium simulii TaxID=133385 RepID=A0A2T9YNS5_9FUNG|nr:hypothetical protein BB561_002915 [Smittium simulii]
MESQDVFGDFDDFQDFNETVDFEEELIDAKKDEKLGLDFQIIEAMLPLLSSSGDEQAYSCLDACADLVFNNSNQSLEDQSSVELKMQLKDILGQGDFSCDNFKAELEMRAASCEDSDSKIPQVDIYDAIAGNMGIPTYYTHVLRHGYEGILATKQIKGKVESIAADFEEDSAKYSNDLSRESYEQSVETEETPEMSKVYGKFDELTIEEIETLLKESAANSKQASIASLLNCIEIMEIHIKTAQDKYKSLKEGSAAYNQVIQVLIEQAEKRKYVSK